MRDILTVLWVGVAVVIGIFAMMFQLLFQLMWYGLVKPVFK